MLDPPVQGAQDTPFRLFAIPVIAECIMRQPEENRRWMEIWLNA